MRSLWFFSIAISGSLLGGCSDDDPVSYSQPVGIELKAEHDKVINGTLSEEKSITTESGNPYGAFVSGAQDALGGFDPGDIDVDEVSVALGAGSDGVVGLGEVFDGTFEVLFLMNDTDDTFDVASGDIEGDDDGGPKDLFVHFDSAEVSDENYEKLLSGSFKVVYRCPAQPSFDGSGAKADLQVTLTFTAYE
ncbi:MAG TPA: hypothetical protein VFU21_10745 [Kofleriaceae bacterium]|nr:hypothetical protein [Kofleriaceae bacterium]